MVGTWPTKAGFPKKQFELTVSLCVIVTQSQVTSDTTPSCFSACNIEKLGMGMRLHSSPLGSISPCLCASNIQNHLLFNWIGMCIIYKQSHIATYECTDAVLNA